MEILNSDKVKKVLITKEDYDSFVFTEELRSAEYLSIEFDEIAFTKSFKIPKNTVFISFSKCEFNKLPKLPSQLLGVVFDSMPTLKRLPKLPTKLVYLYLVKVGVKYLPKLPDGLREMICICNKVTMLPMLPSNVIKEMIQFNYFSRHFNPFGDTIIFGIPRLNDNVEMLRTQVKQLRNVRSLVERF